MTLQSPPMRRRRNTKMGLKRKLARKAKIPKRAKRMWRLPKMIQRTR